MIDNLRKLEKSAGRKLGDTKKPLLVSVRSGAKFSMPGMMDTILNLGLNDETVESLKQETGNGRFAADSYRRFIQMFGNVVLEIPKDVFEHELDAVKKSRGVKADTDLDEAALREVIARYKQVVQEQDRQGVSAGSDRAAQGLAQRGVPLVAEPAREGISPHLRHSRLHRHGRQRAADGVRQHRRSLGDRRRLHAEPGDRREGVLRRVPDQRAGRGRRLRRAHAAADQASSRRCCRRPTSSFARSRRASRSTTRTSRTSSSRSRTRSSTCCRPAAASARAMRRS